jgi:hypothetical protein
MERFQKRILAGRGIGSVESCAAKERLRDQKTGESSRICGRTMVIGNIGINHPRGLTSTSFRPRVLMAGLEPFFGRRLVSAYHGGKNIAARPPSAAQDFSKKQRLRRLHSLSCSARRHEG